MANLQKIVDEVVKPRLAKRGLDKIVLREGFDHDGEEALFIDAQMKSGAGIVGGEVWANVNSALREALLRAGESRFAYFNIRHPEKATSSPFRSRSSR